MICKGSLALPNARAMEDMVRYSGFVAEDFDGAAVGYWFGPDQVQIEAAPLMRLRGLRRLQRYHCRAKSKNYKSCLDVSTGLRGQSAMAMPDAASGRHQNRKYRAL
jgi:hypothetical protein